MPMTLIEKLKQRQIVETDVGSNLFGMRDKVLNTVREEVAKMKTEIMQELRRILEEKIKEDGITTIEGRPGTTPMRGIDYMTPEEMTALKKELKGKDGRRGLPGQSIMGPAGMTGLPGKDSTNMKATDVAHKLNELTETVNMSVIRGLETRLSNIMRAIRSKPTGDSGGGGMSNPQHEQFTGDGSTTSFTLARRVAAGGKAIFGFYQGQQISLTTHFTVANNAPSAIVSTTFTPSAATPGNTSIIEFIYWRA